MNYDFHLLTIEELIALRGKRRLRERGIFKSTQWWREFKGKIKDLRK